MGRLRYIENSRTGSPGTLVETTTPLQFYDDDSYIYASSSGTLKIVAGTELVLEATTITVNGAFGFSGTDSIALGTSGTPLTLTAGSPVLQVYTDCSSTDGSTNAIPSYFEADMTASGGVGRAIEGKLVVSGKLGTYGNAIKGYIDLTGGTGTTGLASAICAEMKMAASVVGTFTVLELELVTPTSSVTQQGTGANCTSFIRMRVSDDSTAVQSFNDYGYLLDLQGLTSGSTDLFDGNTLKCAIGSTKYYLPLSTATASFTTAYPIVSTCSTTAISITGASTYAIQIITDGKVVLGTTSIGIPLSDSEHALAVHSEPGSAFTAYTSSFGIRSRYHISTAQTNIVTFEAVDARLRVKANMAGGVHAGIQGYVEISDSPTLTTGQTHAGGFTVEAGAGTILTSGTLAGVHIDSATADSVDVSNVTYTALRISTGTSSKEMWTYGIRMGDSDAVTGIYVGDATTGIYLDGTYTKALSINSAMADPAVSDGSAAGCQVEATMSGTATGMFSATSSWCNVTGATGTNWVNAVTTGIWESGTGAIQNGVLIFGMRMQAILTNSNFDRLCPFALNASASTVTALFSVGNTNLGGDCGYIEAITESDAPIGYVPLLVDSNGTKHYVRVYADTD